jgi:uncharacterized membrane protein
MENETENFVKADQNLTPKQKAIDQIRAWLMDGTLDAEDLKTISHTDHEKPQDIMVRRINLSEIFYYLGGAIVFLGIVVLVGQNWDVLNGFARVALTFGVGLVFYFVGAYLVNNKISDKVSLPFFLLAGLLIPPGMYVLFDTLNIQGASIWIHTFIWGLSFIVFWFSESVFKKSILTFFTAVYGLLFFYAGTDWLFGQASTKLDYNYFAYRVLIVGLVYLIIGHFIKLESFRNVLKWLFNLVGLFMFLGASLSLGGYKPDQNLFWEMIFPFLSFGAVYLSTIKKSRIYLIVGSIFLMGYFGKITAEYFSNSLGWPITLIVMGLLMIGIGYWSVQINRKYLN